MCFEVRVNENSVYVHVGMAGIVLGGIISLAHEKHLTFHRIMCFPAGIYSCLTSRIERDTEGRYRREGWGWGGRDGGREGEDEERGREGE